LASRRACLACLVGIVPAHAQGSRHAEPGPLRALPNPDSPETPARELFAGRTTPLLGPPRSIGSYQWLPRGWGRVADQGTRLASDAAVTDRYWGNLSLVTFIERLADKEKKVGWNGPLIGDMSQPRGGAMCFAPLIAGPCQVDLNAFCDWDHGGVTRCIVHARPKGSAHLHSHADLRDVLFLVHHIMPPLMEWSGRAPAPPAIEAGKGRQRQGARHVSDTQNRDRRSRHRYW
jgi:hypothetical protein